MSQPALALAFTLALLISASTSSRPTRRTSPAADSTRVIPNDNRAPAGSLRANVLTIRLVARTALWRPEGSDGPELPIYAFAEEGKSPRIPGPLIRVPVGTEIDVSIRNTLPQALRVFGLQDRPGSSVDTLQLSPGAVTTVRFRAGAPGTYLYWGRTARDTFPFGHLEDGQLSGAIVIDSLNAPRPAKDRVFVIGLWRGRETPFGTPVEKREEVLVFNGLSWPHTERMTPTVGDTVHWRFINATRRAHPLHLHGFYYQVEARGTTTRDTIYAPTARRTVVTELLTRGTTMSMTWSPHTPGNWLFHCHLVEHISGKARPAGMFPAAQHSHRKLNHAFDGMSGLVLGIEARPRPGDAPPPERPRRTLRLFVNERQQVFGEGSAYAFVLQEGDREPGRDSIRLPGSTILLRRGEPTAITVINRAREAVAVHWHGIELESYFDGVGDWRGMARGVAPPIAPGDSVLVRMTPPRAGTFIYHTHQHEVAQMGGGLYGPLLVVEPNYERDTTTDRVFLLSTTGPLASSPPNVNGETSPRPVELRKGTTYRLRFINIAPHDVKVIRLLADTALQRWRPVAKDGADLPPHQATPRGARFAMGTGETWDMELTPTESRELTLEIMTLGRAGLPPVRTAIPVYVRD
ncbi:MAG: multicopper oxidase domain-containing protein [Gemmatimonadaceae bacterium]